MTDDAELLRRYAEERQEEAFAELVRRHLGLVHAVALRQVGGDAHLAHDVAQRVFSDLARKAGVLCRHPVLTGWLYRSAQFTAGKAMRTERRRRWREQEAHTMHELTGGSEAEIDPEKLRPVLDTAMGELSDRDRDAVMLRFFEGQAFAQIGAKLRLTEDASRMRVERALGRLRAALAQRGVISTEAALGVALASQAAQAAPAGLASVITGSALAGVGASGSVAALLAFMSTTKSTVGLAAAVIALGFGVKYVGGISATARASLAEERKTTYRLALRVDRAAAEARTLRLRPAVPAAAATGAPAAAQASAVEDEGRGPFGPNPPGSRARGRALLEAYPEIREMLIEQKREFFRGMYAGLYRELALSDEQARTFEDLMISGITSGFIGDPATSVILEASPRLPEAEKDARLRELLGVAGFQRFKEYGNSRDSRPALVASALYYTDTPLTGAQGEQLGQLFSEANRLNRGKKELAIEEYWAPVLAGAATFLSAPQMAALRGVEARDSFNWARPVQPMETASDHPSGADLTVTDRAR